MDKENILNIIKNIRKGSNVKVSWQRKCKTKKAVTDIISKQVNAIGRLGIDYNNQQAVITKRQDGFLPEDPQPLWKGKGVFVQYPYLIEHTGNKQLYLRLYNNTGGISNNVEYFKNGKPVDFDSVKDVLLASEKTEKSGDCFCCKLEDVLSLDGQ